MSTPKVSVVIPVYNTEEYLRECIESLRTQTLSEIEIIIVDDGSKEECARICDEIAETDERIRVIHKENAGAGLARNAGIAEARGEYVGFVDSDDYVAPEMFETLYGAAMKYGADLVLSGMSFVGGNTFSKDGEIEEKDCFDSDTIFEKEGIKKLLLGVVGALPSEPDDSRYGVSVWKNIFKRAVMQHENIEFLSEREVMSEDAIFMIDYIKHIQTAVGIKGAFYRYRRNENSISKSYKSDRLEKVLVFLNEIEAHIRDSVKKDDYGLYLDRLVQGYARILCSQEIMYARDNNIDYKALRARLERICTNEKIAETLGSYPWYKLPIKQAAFAFAMKYKLYLMQKIMVELRAK